MEIRKTRSPIFHIATIANRLDEYAAMKTSFLQAGFCEPACRYTLLDNSVSNNYEPYSAIHSLLETTPEPYLIVCHQDVRVDQGHDFDHLVQVLEALTLFDKDWAIAGNAGGMVREAAVHLVDPNGDHHTAPLPQQVYTLDENLLIIRTAKKVATSSSLAGFHLYGADLCLNAMRQGCASYIIDFRLRHLSSGNSDGEGFQQSKQRFEAYWSRRFWLCLLRTTCTELTLSRLSAVRSHFINDHNRYRLYKRLPLYYKAANFANKFRLRPVRNRGLQI